MDALKKMRTISLFPLKKCGLVDRSHWAEGPWDKEPEDRVQWSDAVTTYPCIAIRTDLGCWSGYVGVASDHPVYGEMISSLPAHGGITFHGLTNDIQHIEPEPESGLAIDVNDPKGVMDILRLKEDLWFFGFDTLHGNDLVPATARLYRSFIRPDGRLPHEYRDFGYIQVVCSRLAQKLDAIEAHVKDHPEFKQLLAFDTELQMDPDRTDPLNGNHIPDDYWLRRAVQGRNFQDA